MKMDIRTREDVELMVSSFYDNVMEDVMLAPIFISTTGIDMIKLHSRMSDFWEDQLFGTSKYDGNPMMKVHIKLSERIAINGDLFDIWLNLFNSTVNSNFEGSRASLAKEQALNIATIMRVKMRMAHA